MRLRTLAGRAAVSLWVVSLVLVYSQSAMASGSYYGPFATLYPTSASGTNAGRCNLCHSSGGGTDLNGYGKDWAVRHNAGRTTTQAFQDIAQANSDGASVSNIDEINASAQPGWTSGLNQLYDPFTLLPSHTANPPTIIGGLLDPPGANQAPVLANPGNRTVNEGVLLQFTITATDDGPVTALVFGGTVPTGATLTDNHDGTATFAWTPSFTQGSAIPYPVTITVTDSGGLSASQSFNITVGNVYRTSADVNGDGKSDVLWHHATLGEVWLWPMDGAVRTAESYVRSVPDTNWEIRGVADFTGDGTADILWRNKTTGVIYLWPMNGSAPLSETYVATVAPAYDIVGARDYDGDGKSDILWRHSTTGAVWIWLMNGATTLSQTFVASVDPSYSVAGSGDLDGDGKADIVWRHQTNGGVWVWLMNGTTSLSTTWVATVPDVGYQIQGVADHTGDGKADIVWHHATTGEVWLWPMDGAARLSETFVATVPDVNYRIVSDGDYDGDGKADILWRHATSGEVWVWLMDGAVRLSETWVGTVGDVGFKVIKDK